jgi:hypothetical protein
MTDKVRMTVAAVVTALFIGATSVAGLAMHASHPATTSVVSAPASSGGHGTAAAQPVAPITTNHESND